MTRRVLLLLAVLALAAAACGGDDTIVTDPGAIDSCDGLAAAGIVLLQDTIDLIDGLDAAALAALGEGSDVPPEFIAIQEQGDALTARAEEIGCSDEQMATLMAERAKDLSADSVFGRFILESVQTGEGDFFG